MSTRGGMRIGSYSVLLTLVACSFVVFSPALLGTYVSDDLNAISQNEYVVGPFEPLRIFSEASWWGSHRADAPGYRPVTTLSFALTYQLFGDNPVAFHAFNFFAHGLVSWLVFMIAVRLGVEREGAAAAALLFCVLPIHTEAVAWMVGRGELLTAAGFAGALLLVLEHRRYGSPATLVGAAGLFLVALFAKENAVTLLAAPLLLALLVPPHSHATRMRDLRSLAALLAALAIYLAARVAATELLPAAPGDALDNPLSQLTTAGRWAGAFSVLGRYLWLTVVPYGLSPDYSYDALGIGKGFVLDACSVVAALACAGLGWAAWRARKQTPAFAFAVALAAAAYSLVSNTVLTIGTVMAERLFYLPTLGLCLAFGAAIGRVAPPWRRSARVAVAALAIVYGAISYTQARVWTTPVALFESAVEAQPGSARARMELASAYGHAGRVEEAVEQFEEAVAIMPDYAAAWYNLGNLYARRQRLAEAVDAYRVALEHAPVLAVAWFNLGVAERLRGRTVEAEAAFARAAELAPNDASVHVSHGDTLLALGRNEEAVAAYTRALAAGAGPVPALVNLGVAKQRARGCEAALPDFLAAVDAMPGDATVLRNALSCLMTAGRIQEAEALRARHAGGGR